MTKRDLARQYRKEHGPEIPTQTLARLMLAENPAMFKDLDTARVSLSAIEGKRLGRRERDNGTKVRESEFYNPEPRTKTPFVIPEQDSDDLENYILPLSFNDFILAGDFHIPNHRKVPIEAMLRYADEYKINQFFLNGDLLDNTPFSKWVHEPVKLDDVKLWFDMAKNFLIELKKRFDEVYWLEGNHDFWYKRWLMGHAELLFRDPYFHLEQRLGLNEIGIKFIDQRYLVKAGHLNIIHGHVVFRGGGSYANAAKMLYAKTKSSTIASHVHVESSHTEPDLNDKIVTTWTTGCMCTLRPEYQPYGGKACHGFAHVKVDKSRDFNVKNIRIQNGKIL